MVATRQEGSTIQDRIHRHRIGDFLIEPSRPIGAWLLDQLFLLSPKTWWGLLLMQTKLPFAPLDVNAMVQSIAGIILPLLLAAITIQLLNINVSNSSNQMGFFSCYMLSPWTVACAMQLLSGCRKFGTSLYSFRSRRTPGLPESLLCLKERVESGRAIRHRRFDVYLPAATATTRRANNKSKNTSSLQQKQKQPTRRVIMLLPGALVPHVAYSTVAARLSDEGFVVVVWSMEPWRLAFRHLGADPKRLGRIQNFLRRQLFLLPRSKTSGENGGAKDISWVLLGHSMGSFAAMRLAADMWKSTSLLSSSVEVPDQLVMWGAASFPGWTTPLPPPPPPKHNDSNNGSGTKVLVIQGSCDGLYLSTLPSRTRFFLPNFSKCPTRHVMIRGANHANFASYVPIKTPRIAGANQAGWDVATISREQQQTLACRLTVQFLKQQQTI